MLEYFLQSWCAHSVQTQLSYRGVWIVGPFLFVPKILLFFRASALSTNTPNNWMNIFCIYWFQPYCGSGTWCEVSMPLMHLFLIRQKLVSVLFLCVSFSSFKPFSSRLFSSNLGQAREKTNDYSGNCIVVFALKLCWCYLLGPMRVVVWISQNANSTGCFRGLHPYPFKAVWV